MNRIIKKLTSPYNPVNRDATMGLGFMILCCLTFLLTSCDTDDISGGYSKSEPAENKKMFTVNFSMNDSPYDENDAVARSASPAENGFEEFVTIPIADNLYMVATLQEEDMPVKLRAVVPLNMYKQVGILAYEFDPDSSEWNNAGYAEYMVISPILNAALYPVGNPLRVGEGNYNFVAYSINKDTLFNDIEEISDPIVDLDIMWGLTNKTITMLDSSVHVTMNHKFSLVRLDAETILGISSVISNLSVAINSFRPTITFENGNLTTTNPIDTVHFKWPYSPPAKIWISDSLYVYTNPPLPDSAPTQTILTVNSVTIDGTTYTNSGNGYSFNYGRVMRAGRSYRLHLRFQDLL